MKVKLIDQISKIMSKRHGIFTENFPCWNSNLTNSRRPSFENDINVTFIS